MKNRKFWAVAGCLAMLPFFGTQSLWAAEEDQAKDLKIKMQAEGWTQIAEGVFKRQRGANKVEHMGFGREGLVWSIADLKARHQRLTVEYQNYPSEELADILDDLSITIAEAQLELRNMAKDMSFETAAIAGANCSNICYGASADAYALTAVQGVAAIADSKFNSNCGYSGDTYAYAYARAVPGGTTTTYSESDPSTGTSVTSHAAATVAGAGPCYSEANAYAQSSALGISYSTSATNSSCPVPAVPPGPTVSISSANSSVFINGTNCKTITWTSSLSGGTAPFTYAWKINSVAAGSTSSISKTYCGNNTNSTQTLNVTLGVTDANGKPGTPNPATYTTTINYSGSLIPDPGCLQLPGQQPQPCV